MKLLICSLVFIICFSYIFINTTTGVRTIPKGEIHVPQSHVKSTLDALTKAGFSIIDMKSYPHTNVVGIRFGIEVGGKMVEVSLPTASLLKNSAVTLVQMELLMSMEIVIQGMGCRQTVQEF
jgi:hypothetical protein